MLTAVPFVIALHWKQLLRCLSTGWITTVGNLPALTLEADRRNKGTRMDLAMIRMNLKIYEPKRDKEARHKSKYSTFQKT